MIFLGTFTPSNYCWYRSLCSLSLNIYVPLSLLFSWLAFLLFTLAMPIPSIQLSITHTEILVSGYQNSICCICQKQWINTPQTSPLEQKDSLHLMPFQKCSIAFLVYLPCVQKGHWPKDIFFAFLTAQRARDSPPATHTWVKYKQYLYYGVLKVCWKPLEF